ncbi:MAG: hypothetical protein WD877_02935 [Candidatus Saccharimonadales bacterium]
MIKTPDELRPAYERPVDQSSIDQRMAAQLDWEGSRRVAPRDVLSAEVIEPSTANVSKHRARKTAAVVGAAVLSAVGISYLFSEAYGHEIKQSPSSLEQPK